MSGEQEPIIKKEEIESEEQIIHEKAIRADFDPYLEKRKKEDEIKESIKEIKHEAPQEIQDKDSLISTQNAEDKDVIEKEWVLKAETIIKENKFNPFEEEEKEEDLQIEYLKKRFGKDIPKSED